jgi:hypothetical protein
LSATQTSALDLTKEGQASGYLVSVPRSRKDLIAAIEQLLRDSEALYRKENPRRLPRLRFDRHIYQPLLLQGDDAVRMAPPGLNRERSAVRARPESLRAQEQEHGQVV